MTRLFAVALAVVLFVLGVATGLVISTHRFCNAVLGGMLP